jgi:hypothetical protein
MKILEFKPLYDERAGRPKPKGAKRPKILNTHCDAVALCLSGPCPADTEPAELFWGFLSALFDDDAVDDAKASGIPAAVLLAEDFAEDDEEARAALESSMYKEGELKERKVRTSRVFDLHPPFEKGMWIVVGPR